MVLAAGVGDRLRPLTDTMPKPMVTVGGRPILEHNIRLLARHGIRDVVINLHHCPERVTSHFGAGADYGVRIEYSRETVLLGTAGAVKNVASQFDRTFLVVYGDNLSTCDVTGLLAFHRERRAMATVALFRRDDYGQSGVADLNEHGRITRFVEKPGSDAVTSHWVNAGVLALEPGVLNFIHAGAPSDFGRDILPALIDAGEPVWGYRMGADEGLWWIDTPDALEAVRAAWSSERRA